MKRESADVAPRPGRFIVRRGDPKIPSAIFRQVRGRIGNDEGPADSWRLERDAEIRIIGTHQRVVHAPEAHGRAGGRGEGDGDRRARRQIQRQRHGCADGVGDVRICHAPVRRAEREAQVADRVLGGVLHPQREVHLVAGREGSCRELVGAQRAPIEQPAPEFAIIGADLRLRLAPI